jgi:hypothetical protein
VGNYTGCGLKRKDRAGSSCDQFADLLRRNESSPEKLPLSATLTLAFFAESVNSLSLQQPVDKVDQNCVEREDLCAALRYDPPFR